MGIVFSGIFYFYRYPKSVTGKQIDKKSVEFQEKIAMYPELPEGEKAIFDYNTETKTYWIFKDGKIYAGETVGKKKFERISGRKL